LTYTFNKARGPVPKTLFKPVVPCTSIDEPAGDGKKNILAIYVT